MSIKARQARDAIALLAIQTGSAAARRTAIAAAGQAWMKTVPGTTEAEEADVAFEAALIENQIIEDNDVVMSIDAGTDENTITVILNVDGGVEVLEIGISTGNIMRGTA
jgi:hypothetical protein